MKIAAVVADFYPQLAERLLESCCVALCGHNIAPPQVVRVSGALEIPLALQIIAGRREHEALVALGCVIRGETHHFEVVSEVCAYGILQVQLQTGMPVGNGVLMVDNMAQAQARVDKGAVAAEAAVQLAKLAGGGHGG